MNRDPGSASGGKKRTGVSGLAAVAQDEVKTRVERGASVAATVLGDVADALRNAGDHLVSRERSAGAKLAQDAADKITALSQSLSDASVEDMIDGVRDFARARPLAFVAGAAAAGFAVARLATASSRAFETAAVAAVPNGSDPGPKGLQPRPGAWE